MVKKVVWTTQALKDYENIKKYLIENFGDTVFRKFFQHLLRKIALIQHNPNLSINITEKKYPQSGCK